MFIFLLDWKKLVFVYSFIFPRELELGFYIRKKTILYCIIQLDRLSITCYVGIWVKKKTNIIINNYYVYFVGKND